MAKGDKIRLFLAALCVGMGILFCKVFTAVRFSGFLLICAGAALLLFSLLNRWAQKSRTGKVLRRMYVGLLGAGFLFFAVLEGWILSCAHTDRETPVAAVIIFGAGVNGRTPSFSLLSRLEAALAYIQDNPNIPIVVTGCQGEGEQISEARCMADWLTAHGVAGERILLEERATNTEENIIYSMALLRDHGVDTTASLAFCTSDYHLCRAMYLRGYHYTVPVAAHMSEKYLLLTINYYIREAFALAAALVF